MDVDASASIPQERNSSSENKMDDDTSAGISEEIDSSSQNKMVVEDNAGEWVFPRRKKRKTVASDDAKAKKKRPYFPPSKGSDLNNKEEFRRVPVPVHRLTPVKQNWLKIFTPIVQYLNLDVRYNIRKRAVEIKSSKKTKDVGAIQKASDFVQAFVFGFEVEDALALIRLDELFLETFEVKDVKTLNGDHLSRCIGRMVGKNGKTKYTIENATKTRIVVANSKIHLLGSYQNIRAARRTICNLILGLPPSKVYGTMKAVANRLSNSI